MAAAHPRRDLSPHLISPLPRMDAVPPDSWPHASSPRAPSSSRATRSAAPSELIRPSRMALTPEDVPMQVKPSTERKKHIREEDEEDGDEREVRLRARVTALASIPGTAKVATATTAGTTSKRPRAGTASASGSSPPRPLVRQQVGHLLARVIEQGDTSMSSPIWSSSIENDVARATQGGERCKRRKSPSARSNIDLNADLEEVTQLEELNEDTSSRTMQGGQSCRKRKSPCSNIFVLRSPLSRMILSPILGTPCAPSPRTRSPFLGHRTSPLARARGSRRLLTTIDLNVEPEEINTELEELNAGMEEANTELEEAIEGVAGPLPTQERVHRKEVPDDIRRSIFDALLARSKSGSFKGHETGEVSREFSVPLQTVQRIWAEGKRCLDQGIPVNVSSKKSRRGRKKKEVDLSKLRGLSILSRTTLQDTSKELGCSKSKLRSLRREGVIHRVSNTIKPFLTDKNKKQRLEWCLSMLDPRSIPHDPIFKDLFDFVFIDEKWFNITKKTIRYYKTPDEVQQARTCKSTNFIPKIMFLAAFARPRFSNGVCTFDGKIGCFAFVTYVVAKRSSVNRKAGTVEMKPINSIKQSVVREFLIDKVLPAIRAKWPREDINKPIFIQQDNAPSHVSPNDKLFCEAAKKDGFDIRLVCQPPNSPDFNILDLGFFSSIQSLQHKTSAKTTEELVAAVDEAFQDYSPWKVNRIFLTLHSCLKEVMKIDGGNAYDVPHIRKEMLEREGRLPVQLDCEPALVQKAMDRLNE